MKVELINSIKLNHLISEKLSSNHIVIAIKVEKLQENEGGRLLNSLINVNDYQLK